MLRVHGPAIKRGITIDTVTPTQLRAVVATRVTPSPTVRVTDANGSPVAGVEVFFKVTAGGGTALPLSGVGTSSARTDLTGRATADWTLGTKAIADTLSVGVGTLAPVVFTALATPGPFAQLVPDEGEGQIAAPGSTLPHALRAKATDTFGNPIAGVPVTFSVISGEGTIDGATAISDSTGLATSSQWTLGSSLGWQHVRAQSGEVAAVFTAESTCALEALEVFCSPSGQLVFSRPTDGQAYRVGANGTGLTRLTTSATRRRIAFTASHPGAGLGDIDLMDADGSHVVRRLTDFLRTMRDPPPGRRTGRRSPSCTLIAMRDMKRST